MSFGLLSTGFVRKTLETVRAELDAAVQAAFGTSIDVSDESVLGQLSGIVAERISELWELAEAAYTAQRAGGATGTSLDEVMALTGTLRRAATSSSVTMTMTTSAGTTTIPSGSRVAVESTEKEFQTSAAVVPAVLTSWVQSTAYIVGDRRTANSKCYICVTAGTSSGSGTGPSTDGTAISDGTAEWDYLGDGTAAGDVLATSVETGPIIGSSGTITEIVTPVSGWNNATNRLDATLGRNRETDEDARVRRQNELAGGGSATVNAVRAAVSAVSGVTNVTVFENDTDGTVDGMPPHSIEALVIGGTDQDIFDALLASAAAGIKTHGSTSGTAEDSEGNSFTVQFTRPTEIDIYVAVTLTFDDQLYPSDGDDQVKTAIANYGNTQAVGKDVVSSSLKAQAFGVAGAIDVTVANIGTSASPSAEVTVTIGTREIAKFDTSRITVSSSDYGTP